MTDYNKLLICIVVAGLSCGKKDAGHGEYPWADMKSSLIGFAPQVSVAAQGTASGMVYFVDFDLNERAESIAEESLIPKLKHLRRTWSTNQSPGIILSTPEFTAASIREKLKHAAREAGFTVQRILIESGPREYREIGSDFPTTLSFDDLRYKWAFEDEQSNH